MAEPLISIGGSSSTRWGTDYILFQFTPTETVVVGSIDVWWVNASSLAGSVGLAEQFTGTSVVPWLMMADGNPCKVDTTSQSDGRNTFVFGSWVELQAGTTYCLVLHGVATEAEAVPGASLVEDGATAGVVRTGTSYSNTPNDYYADFVLYEYENASVGGGGGGSGSPEMLGNMMLGGSMIGGDVGGGGGLSNAMIGDWFVGFDMLGGGPGGTGGGGGGGGGGTVDAYGGRVEGGSSAAGDLGILTIHPVEAAPSGQSSVSGSLNFPTWAGGGQSDGESGSESAVLRYEPPATLPFEETYDPVEDFPQGDGDYWNLDKWFTKNRPSTRDNTSAVDVRGGKGRVATGGYYEHLNARAVARQVPFGDVEITFDHTSSVTWEAGLYYFFRASPHHEWTFPTSGVPAPKQAYAVHINENSVYLYRVSNYGFSRLASMDYATFDHVEGRAERMRIRIVGGHIQVKNWDAAASEPVGWSFDYSDTPDLIGPGVLGFSVYSGYDRWGRWATINGIDSILIERIPAELDGSAAGDSSVVAEVSLPTMFTLDPIEGSSGVTADADVHLLSGGEAVGEAAVTGELQAHHPLGGQVSGSSVVGDPHLDAYAYEALAYDCSSEVEADPDVEYEVTVAVAGSSSVAVDLTNLVEIEITIPGSSTVTVEAEKHMLPGGLIEGSSEVAFHLRYIDDIVRMLVDTSAGESTVTSGLSATVSLWAESAGSTSFSEALLTYWKPMTPVTVQGSSSLIGQFEIYTIPPDPIEGSSVVDAHLEGDYQYTAEIESTSTVTINVPMDVELYFLPGPINGYATATGYQFTVAPSDLQVSQIEGSSEFVSVGTGYLVLNLGRGLWGETTSTLTASSAHPYTGTHFEQAILGMPVVIGRYQTYIVMGNSDVRANLFINEGGQANCDSRVSALVNLLKEVYLEGETTGTPSTGGGFPRSYIDIPDDIDYWRPEPTPAVLNYIADTFGGYEPVIVHDATYGMRVSIRGGHVPCGTGFLWADFWPHGMLEPQVSQGFTGVGQFDDNGRNVHPFYPSENKQTGTYSGWNRDAGYFVSNMGMNTLGLFATTSTEDDFYSQNETEPRMVEDEEGNWVYVYSSEGQMLWERSEFGEQVWSDVRAGRGWTPQFPSRRFHGRCGTVLDVDLFVELKNALYAHPVGFAQVVADFIILQYRSITVLGNIAREVDRDTSVTGGTARSPNIRAPLTLRPPGVGRNLDPVRSGRTLYT